MKKFKEQIYLHRSKEENWSIVDKAKEIGFEKPDDLVWLSTEVGLEVEVCEDGKHKVLTINGVNVEDKNIII